MTRHGRAAASALAAAALAASACAPGTEGGSRGRAAPDFALASLGGGTVALADLRGKVVLLHFWATWCAPCKVETPRLVDLDRRYRSAGLAILAVSMDDAGHEQAAAAFAAAHGVTFPVLRGTADIARAYGGARLLPTSVLIGRDGALLETIAGLPGEHELEAAVRRALARPGG
ncbi:MAG TPA: TlpA disulfide reductase family protein [Kofleriaceae bacterium]|nr:TlpA disulfide reductase family protein [Kofleriaceae bacterium]